MQDVSGYRDEILRELSSGTHSKKNKYMDRRKSSTQLHKRALSRRRKQKSLNDMDDMDDMDDSDISALNTRKNKNILHEKKSQNEDEMKRSLSYMDIEDFSFIDESIQDDDFTSTDMSKTIPNGFSTRKQRGRRDKHMDRGDKRKERGDDNKNDNKDWHMNIEIGGFDMASASNASSMPPNMNSHIVQPSRFLDPTSNTRGSSLSYNAQPSVPFQYGYLRNANGAFSTPLDSRDGTHASKYGAGFNTMNPGNVLFYHDNDSLFGARAAAIEDWQGLHNMILGQLKTMQKMSEDEITGDTLVDYLMTAMKRSSLDCVLSKPTFPEAARYGTVDCLSMRELTFDPDNYEQYVNDRRISAVPEHKLEKWRRFDHIKTTRQKSTPRRLFVSPPSISEIDEETLFKKYKRPHDFEVIDAMSNYEGSQYDSFGRSAISGRSMDEFQNINPFQITTELHKSAHDAILEGIRRDNPVAANVISHDSTYQSVPSINPTPVSTSRRTISNGAENRKASQENSSLNELPPSGTITPIQVEESKDPSKPSIFKRIGTYLWGSKNVEKASGDGSKDESKDGSTKDSTNSVVKPITMNMQEIINVTSTPLGQNKYPHFATRQREGCFIVFDNMNNEALSAEKVPDGYVSLQNMLLVYMELEKMYKEGERRYALLKDQKEDEDQYKSRITKKVVDALAWIRGSNLKEKLIDDQKMFQDTFNKNINLGNQRSMRIMPNRLAPFLHTTDPENGPLDKKMLEMNPKLRHKYFTRICQSMGGIYYPFSVDNYAQFYVESDERLYVMFQRLRIEQDFHPPLYMALMKEFRSAMVWHYMEHFTFFLKENARGLWNGLKGTLTFNKLDPVIEDVLKILCAITHLRRDVYLNDPAVHSNSLMREQEKANELKRRKIQLEQWDQKIMEEIRPIDRSKLRMELYLQAFSILGQTVENYLQKHDPELWNSWKTNNM